MQAAAPEEQPNAALNTAALKLVNSLAGSQHAAVFQAAVAQLPQAAKQRLQVLCMLTCPPITACVPTQQSLDHARVVVEA